MRRVCVLYRVGTAHPWQRHKLELAVDRLLLVYLAGVWEERKASHHVENLLLWWAVRATEPTRARKKKRRSVRYGYKTDVD